MQLFQCRGRPWAVMSFWFVVLTTLVFIALQVPILRLEIMDQEHFNYNSGDEQKYWIDEKGGANNETHWVHHKDTFRAMNQSIDHIPEVNNNAPPSKSNSSSNATKRPSAPPVKATTAPIFVEQANLTRVNLTASPSWQWRPKVITTCLANNRSAPCILERNPNTNLVQAQELEYPNFRIKLPGFMSEKEERDWLALVKGRFKTGRFHMSADDKWLEYKFDNFGQNLLFLRASYPPVKGYPTDGWGPEICMGTTTDHRPFFTRHGDLRSEETLIVATTPATGLFQHFTDRSTNIMVQSRFIIPDDSKERITMVVNGIPNFLYLHDFTHVMGVHQLVSGSSYKSKPKKVIFPCRTPLIHPYLMLKFNEHTGLYKNGIVPLSERKLVVYFPRHNRKVVNEAEMLDAVRKLLAKRGKGEELVDFDYRNRNFREFLNYYASNTVAMFGVHGGALYNARFTFPDTLLIEIQPKTKFGYIFLEQSRLLGHNYHCHLVEGIGAGEAADMKADIPALMAVFERELGRECGGFASPMLEAMPDAGPRPLEEYPWKPE